MLTSDLFGDARDALEATMLKFSADAISDERVRARYAEGIRRVSQLVQSEVDSGKMTAYEGAVYCNQLRNQILVETRKVTSSWNRARAEKKKPFGPTIEESVNKYSNRLYGKPFSALTSAEKEAASYAVIASAGRNDTSVTAGTTIMRDTAKGTILLTAGLAAYAILRADDKVTEVARQGTVIGGGVLGGYVTGMSTAALCGTGAPLCALAIAILGTISGSVVTEYAFDQYEIAVKELQKWGIQ
ncbi:MULTISPECIES: hypothetical protein [unclassified Caballeronia]|uniref:hypothetical protein n=1 Tax=unclassified Caballeronia TaxID=2646786 RepID=UPI0028662CF2|nr:MULTISPECIES: hypothetical protein [unclassified Caballeronia]MDR5736561.1 hypothetical protein [Caballeronia sp. LZ016]MDR5810960.1 hypothetical protein [Caballeronia sp. LZ019]